MSMETTGQEKIPAMMSVIDEVFTAVEAINVTIRSICEALRLPMNPPGPQKDIATPSATLIDERIERLDCLRPKLYDANARLEGVLSAVREI